MHEKEKCRRCDTGTMSAAAIPQHCQLSFSTTATARQEESAPPRFEHGTLSEKLLHPSFLIPTV
jgi:hypothetical protein